jgi:hypothetical protein
MGYSSLSSPSFFALALAHHSPKFGYVSYVNYVFYPDAAVWTGVVKSKPP